MSAIHSLNPEAEHVRQGQALLVNIQAAKDLMEVMKTGLGPNGTQKMLVSGGGEIKITKDGAILLSEMRINIPTAALIARTATAQDTMTGDGTTKCILLIGELLEQAQRYIREGVHPRVIVEGLEQAKDIMLQYMDKVKLPLKTVAEINGKDINWVLEQVAYSAISTKLSSDLARHLAKICSEAVRTIQVSSDAAIKLNDENNKTLSEAAKEVAATPEDIDKQIDLHMVEILAMMHRSCKDTRLVKGLVLDHGTRHADMKKRLKNAYILCCNISFEYEKTEINSVLAYSNAAQRDALIASERQYVNERCQAIIDLKNKVCGEHGEKGRDFFLLTLKGIDLPSLDAFAAAGISAVRRAKRRNLERIARACGGHSVNTVEGLDESCLGFASDIHEEYLGEDVYTFIEGVERPFSCTILIKGPAKYDLIQIKDACRDGLRAVRNALVDGCVLSGAASFECGASAELQRRRMTVGERSKLGVQTYSEALLVIPKILATNSGLDAHEALIKLQDGQSLAIADSEKSEKKKDSVCPEAHVGIDITNPGIIDPIKVGVFDGYSVEKQLIQSSTTIACQLLLVDELLKAGRRLSKDVPDPEEAAME